MSSEKFWRMKIILEDSHGNLRESGLLNVDNEMQLSLIKTAVVDCFPELENQQHVLGWVDEEGDYVTMSSDEELKIALAEMKGNMLEVQVKTKQEKKERDKKDLKLQLPKQYFASLRTAQQNLLGKRTAVHHKQTIEKMIK